MGVAELIAARKRSLRPVSGRPVGETARVLSLPVVRHGGGRVVPSAEVRRPNAPLLDGKPVELRPLQAQALGAIEAAGGGFFPLGVGEGKTLISFLAHLMVGTRKTILLVPPSLRVKTGSDHLQWRPYFKVDPNMDVVAYSAISHQNGIDLLERIVKGYDDNEVLIIADEAHCLARFEAARTKRFLRFFAAHRGVRFVCMSGTMTKRAVKDFAHLAELALGEGAPLPIDEHHLEAWGACIDVKGKPSSHEWVFVDELIKWWDPKALNLRGKDRVEAARKAFAHRLQSTAGVVKSGEHTVKASLQISVLKVAPPRRVLDALDGVRGGQVPGGFDVYPSEAHQALDARRVSLGYYYWWDWSRVGLAGPDAEWVEARKHWHQAVRRELERRSSAEYDSPGLVARRCALVLDEGHSRGQLPEGVVECYRRWREVRHRYDLDKLRATTWLSDYAVQAALDWQRAQKTPSIIWYQGRALEDAFVAAGVRTYGQGTELTGPAHNCAASIQVHGTGRNLQDWRTQIIVGCPSAGDQWEQLLGRTHRNGQKADSVEVTLLIPTKDVLQAVVQARKDAKYVGDTMQAQQRLLSADWVTPLPKPSEVA